MDKITLDHPVLPTCYYQEPAAIKFDPPVFEQRYSFVYRLLKHKLWKGEIKKVFSFDFSHASSFTVILMIL